MCEQDETKIKTIYFIEASHTLRQNYQLLYENVRSALSRYMCSCYDADTALLLLHMIHFLIFLQTEMNALESQRYTKLIL